MRMGGALAPPSTRLTHKVASQDVPWIEIMAHYQPTRGTELDLEIS